MRDEFATTETTYGRDWICKYKIRRKNARSGYTNLVSQVQFQNLFGYHISIGDTARSTESNSNQTPSLLSYKKKPALICRWIDLQVNALQPFKLLDILYFEKQYDLNLLGTKLV